MVQDFGVTSIVEGAWGKYAKARREKSAMGTLVLWVWGAGGGLTREFWAVFGGIILGTAPRGFGWRFGIWLQRAFGGERPEDRAYFRRYVALFPPVLDSSTISRIRIPLSSALVMS